MCNKLFEKIQIQARITWKSMCFNHLALNLKKVKAERGEISLATSLVVPGVLLNFLGNHIPPPPPTHTSPLISKAIWTFGSLYRSPCILVTYGRKSYRRFKRTYMGRAGAGAGAGARPGPFRKTQHTDSPFRSIDNLYSGWKVYGRPI